MNSYLNEYSEEEVHHSYFLAEPVQVVHLHLSGAPYLVHNQNKNGKALAFIVLVNYADLHMLIFQAKTSCLLLQVITRE